MDTITSCKCSIINPFTFQIVQYKIYLGKIDLNNHGNGTNVTYSEINASADCQPYLDACVEAFRRFASNPSSGEPSGGIQDWAISPEGDALYSYFGIENGLFRLNLSDLTTSCIDGPAANGPFTGQTGAQTDEFGGIYFEGGQMYGWQVDRGRLFTISRSTGLLTLIDSSLPKDYRGDNAGCYNCGSVDEDFEGDTIEVCPEETTTYVVTVTDANGCTGTRSVTVTVKKSIQVNISGNNELCVGESTTLTASGGGSYLWSTGATTASITVSPAINTVYSVTVTSEGECTGTASVEVIVNPAPEVEITGRTEICEGECTTLTATGGVTYSWTGAGNNGFRCKGPYFVGGLQNGAPQSLYRYQNGQFIEIGPLGTNWVNGMGYYCGTNNQPKLYAMRMPGTEPLNAVRAFFTEINPLTGAATVLSEIPQPPNPYGVLGITGIFNFVADISKDGYYYFPAAAAIINPFTFQIVQYKIYLGKIDLNNHGNGTNVTYSEINASADCQPYLDACVEAFRRFASDPSSGEPSGGIQDWAISPEGDALYSYFGIENGLFRLNLSDLTTSCIDGPAANGPFTGQTGAQTDEFGGIYFEGGQMYGWQVDRGRLFTISRSTGLLTLIDSSLPKDYRGDNAGCYNCGTVGEDFEGDTIEVCPEETTTYVVTVTDVNGCTATKSVTVTVNPNPVVSITGAIETCAGNSVTLTASGGVSYIWSTGASGGQITVSPIASTTYSVTATDANGCTGTASHIITVHPVPVPQFSGTTQICTGESTTITVSGGTQQIWSTGDVTSSITVSPSQTTVYTVTVTNSFGCSAVGSVTVSVNESLMVSISGNNEVCIGGSTTLTASPGMDFIWSTGANTASITVSPTQTQTYTVTATNANGCSGTASVTVTIGPGPDIQITGRTEICEGECTTLTATGGVTYSWTGAGNNGFRCKGSYFVGGLQNGAPQSLYRYQNGQFIEIGPLGTNWVNGMGYYCGTNNQPKLYAMRMPGTDPANAVRAFFTEINPLTGAATVLSEIPQPQNPYGALGVTGIFNFVADISKDGIYYFPAAAALINPLTFQIVEYKIYVGQINVNNHGNGTNVTYSEINASAYCQPYLDACVEAFRRFASDPSSGEPSGGIQDWAISPEGDALYSYFGIENGLFRLNLSDLTTSCIDGPAANGPFTGQTGAQTDEFGGIYFEGGQMYGWQVDRGRLFTISRSTGLLTLIDSSLPKDYRGDNAGCYNCGTVDEDFEETPLKCALKKPLPM
ncbi:MAG: hypothetical protein IPM26_10970 [Saprospiraceae bacterium]|nr:hypothetical protein [Saprospiraceae bacterium]